MGAAINFSNGVLTYTSDDSAGHAVSFIGDEKGNVTAVLDGQSQDFTGVTQVNATTTGPDTVAGHHTAKIGVQQGWKVSVGDNASCQLYFPGVAAGGNLTANLDWGSNSEVNVTRTGVAAGGSYSMTATAKGQGSFFTPQASGQVDGDVNQVYTDEGGNNSVDWNEFSAGQGSVTTQANLARDGSGYAALCLLPRTAQKSTVVKGKVAGWSTVPETPY